MLDKRSEIRIREIISEKKPVVIVPHINPDGDAIGSSTALARFLQNAGVPVNICIPNEVPEFLNWLPGYELVTTYTKDPEVCKSFIKNASAIFMLDFNELGRAGEIGMHIKASTAYTILVDHHQQAEKFSDILISESWRGSVGEMVYILMCESGGKQYIDKDIATSLYVAIMTDTGNFRYSSSYKGIFDVVGDLMEYGIDKDEIFSLVYDSYSERRMKLMGYCMLEKLVVLPQYNVAYISITKEELKKFDHQVGDTEGFVNIPFTIKGIRLTALFIEKNNHVKISLRSKGRISVDAIARKYFYGGGHINAAGGEDKLPLKETLQKFEQLLSEYKDVLSD